MAFRRSALPNFLQSTRAFRYSTIPLSPNSPSLIHGIHVFHCPDEVGIVAKLSECIAQHGANIHYVDVFVPEKKQVFYSRSEFVFDPVRWPHDVMLNDFMNIGKLFNAKRSVVRVPDLDPKYKIALLASKQDHCLVDVLHDWQYGRLPVDISCVISNHDRAPNTHVINFLKRHGIPYYFLPTDQGNNREKEILDLVKGTDFLVLARYMQLLSAGFLESYGKDIINIHHGLLPSFKGSNPAKQAYNAGVKLIGATTHFVTQELDAGPIIEQMVERVSHKDSLQSFVQKSQSLEKQCLRRAIQSYCELRVLPYEEALEIAHAGDVVSDSFDEEIDDEGAEELLNPVEEARRDVEDAIIDRTEGINEERGMRQRQEREEKKDLDTGERKL